MVVVDQSLLARTPRSNPAVYTGAFDDVRELFAQTEAAQQRGLGASAFSFNSAQGQCERCRGAGFEKIEMQFLSDIFVRCPECDGRRYRAHILEIQAGPPGGRDPGMWPACWRPPWTRRWNFCGASAKRDRRNGRRQPWPCCRKLAWAICASANR